MCISYYQRLLSLDFCCGFSRLFSAFSRLPVYFLFVLLIFSFIWVADELVRYCEYCIVSWIFIAYFSEDKRLFVVDRIEAVVRNRSCPKLFAYRVRRQAIHVHLNVRSNFLVRQKLSRDHLYTKYDKSENACLVHVMHNSAQSYACSLWNFGSLAQCNKIQSYTTA